MKTETRNRLKEDFPAVYQQLLALWHLAPGTVTLDNDQRESLEPELVALVESHYTSPLDVAERRMFEQMRRQNAVLLDRLRTIQRMSCINGLEGTFFNNKDPE